MAFELPPLPYAANALEPHIDEQTMNIHHGKHHQAYVTNLNKALEAHADLQSKSIEELLSDLSAIPEGIRMAVRNNGGGHWNHTFFWKLMTLGGRDQRQIRQLRRIQGGVQGGGSRSIWLRLGMADHGGRWQPQHRKHAQSG